MASRTSPHHNSTLLLSPSIGRTHRTLAAGDSPSYHRRDQCHLRHLTPSDGPLFYGDYAEETLGTIGFMNLTSVPFGGMPMCRGAGRMAGQFRYGARTGGANVYAGLILIALV